jgi:aspartate aminotransferase
MQLSKRALSLQESAIRKLDTIVRQQTGCHFYRLNIGQPDIATPKPMLDAITRFQPKTIAYGPASGTPACREAFAQYHSRWQPQLTGKHISVTTGGSEALLFAFTAICDPGDEIMVPTPFYTNYNGFATVAGARIKAIPTSINDNFALPSNAILDSLKTQRTKAFVFSNPGNPTGAIYSSEEIKRLANWCHHHGIFLIADEVYRRIWFEEPPASALELNDAAEAIIVIDSLSKTWSACGLRLGALISRNEELMEKVERLGQARLGAQPLAQSAGIAALNMSEQYYEDVRQTWKTRVDAMYKALNTIPGITHNKPKGAFYTMVELPVDSSENFARYLITDFRSNNESLVVAPGGGFYADPRRGEKQIRLAAVLEEQKINRAIEILGEALQKYN